MKNGLLIINLGTPDNPSIPAVRRYLSQFLCDKRVIDLPAALRYLLVYATILPFRAKKSAHAYQAIWTAEGSPLLIHGRRLQAKLQEKLGDSWSVALGMRYGNPSIPAALNQLEACDKLTILPLYPQYSSAATGSSLEDVLQALAPQNTFPFLTVIRDFYQQPAFIEAQAALIKPYLASHDHLLLSYHGLPERHIVSAGCKTVCSTPCPSMREANATCYKAQCYATTAALAQELHLSAEKFTTAFQSRLGRTPWIKPYTDELLPELAQKGIKRLAVSCPSFVADCLETLEEIGLRAKEQWSRLGGEQLTMIPCVNDSDLWVSGLIKLIEMKS